MGQNTNPGLKRISNLSQSHDHTSVSANHKHDHEHAHTHGAECSCGHDHSHDEHAHTHGAECSCGHDHSHDEHAHAHGAECSCGHDHSHEGHNHHHGHSHGYNGHEHDHSHGGDNGEEVVVLDSSLDTFVFRISGLDCADCAAKLRQQVAKLAGVEKADLSFASAKLRVQGGVPEAIMALVADQGYHATQEATLNASGGRKAVLLIQGMDCAECAKALGRHIQRQDGVVNAQVHFASGKMEVVFQQTTLASIIEQVEVMGYTATPYQATMLKAEKRMWWKERRNQLTLFSGLTFALGLVLEHLDIMPVAIVVYLVGMLGGGYYVARAGFSALRRGVMDMNFLMTVAAIGAVLIQQWEEASAVVFLFSLGNAMQSFSMEHTRDSIRALMDLAPHEATVLRDGKEYTLPVEALSVGERILVRSGEKISMDGRVVRGASAVDQAAITGESTPVDREVGDEVFAGTLNLQGSLEIEVTKPYTESTVARILHLVEEAQDQRAPSQQFVDKFAAVYTPIVIALAIGLATIPPLLFAQSFADWFYRALQLLVISCPCALTISTPVSIVSAIGNASRRGILIKGGAYLEAAGAAKVVAFDKTGTLTAGAPQVKSIVAMEGLEQREVLRLAASLERLSTHPLAKAIVKASQNDGLELSNASDFSDSAGLGVAGSIDGVHYCVGGDRMVEDILNTAPEWMNTVSNMKGLGMSLAYVASDNQILGIIGLEDRVRPESAAAIQDLKRDGIAQVAMLTGDQVVPARALASQLGIDIVHAQLLPDEKLARIRELEAEHGQVIMVGDGINDAPAMAAATVSIAMGVGGSDIALETADMALMGDDLSRVAWCIGLSRRTLGIIHQNIVFSVVTKLIVLALAVVGMANLWLAVFADSGTALIVIFNGMRLMRWDRRSESEKVREGQKAQVRTA